MPLLNVSDEVIENVINAYETNDEKFFKDQEALAEEQPAIDALFTDESLDLLNDDEYELLWFISTVVYTSMKKVGKLPHADPEKVVVWDENNWEKFENAKGSFYEKITTFYEDYPQEDLLAFVEDCLENEEDDDEPVDITSTGRELIFISCKTMIDVLSE